MRSFASICDRRWRRSRASALTPSQCERGGELQTDEEDEPSSAIGTIAPTGWRVSRPTGPATRARTTADTACASSITGTATQALRQDRSMEKMPESRRINLLSQTKGPQPHALPGQGTVLHSRGRAGTPDAPQSFAALPGATSGLVGRRTAVRPSVAFVTPSSSARTDPAAADSIRPAPLHGPWPGPGKASADPRSWSVPAVSRSSRWTRTSSMNCTPLDSRLRSRQTERFCLPKGSTGSASVRRPEPNSLCVPATS